MAETSVDILKVNAAERLVFGWASVSANEQGALLEDLQGDTIEPAELEKAAYDFTEHFIGVNDSHEGGTFGTLVESLVVTPEKLEAMGFTPEVAKSMGVRHWIGVRVTPDIFKRVQSGELKMFSIEGRAERVPA